LSKAVYACNTAIYELKYKYPDKQFYTQVILMPSNPQLKLMTELLHLEGVIVTNYHIIADIGIVLHLENRSRETECIYCGNKTGKLHQNNELTIRDLPFGEQALYLKINRRQMRCENCGKKFIEELNYVSKKKNLHK
jgi:transposase